MKYLLLLTIFISSSTIMADNNRPDRAIWVAKMKLDLAELKGPPLLADLEVKRANKIADLDLLINSGKYKEGELKRIKAMREKLMERELPSQEALNERHDRRLKMAKSKMRNRGEMLNRKHINEGRKRDMRDRNEWEKRRNRPRKR